jgi:hypothetical protein
VKQCAHVPVRSWLRVCRSGREGQFPRPGHDLGEQKALKTGRGLEKFPEIVARLAGWHGRTVLHQAGLRRHRVHPDGVLDELPLPSQIGATRSGGIDLNRPRSRAVLAAALRWPSRPAASPANPGRTRRYFISPAAACIISACSPSGTRRRAPPGRRRRPRFRRTPRHQTDIDRHYQVLRLEIMVLFADTGIACG